MKSRSACLAITLALGLLTAVFLASPVSAEVKASLKMELPNHENPIILGQKFKIRATLTYSGAPRDSILDIALASPDPGSESISNLGASRRADKGVNGTGLCSGSFTLESEALYRKSGTNSIIGISGYGTIKSASGAILATSATGIELKVLPTPVLSISKIDYVKPPDIITTMETMPVVVHLTYAKMPAENSLGVVIEDQDGKGTLGSWTSRRLSGAGSLTSDPIQIRLTASKTWNLAAKVSAIGGVASARKTFQVKVESGVTIAHIQRPEGTIRLSEQAPIVVTIDYEGLPAVGQALMAKVSNKDTKAKLGSSTSTRLAGKGSFTFQPIVIKPSSIGDWNIKVEIADLGSNVITSKWLTIKVIQ